MVSYALMNWSGSTPRTRWKGKQCSMKPEAWGLNPTYTVERPLATRTAGNLGAQPHVHGGKGLLSLALLFYLGSTPRTRWKGFLTRRNTCWMSEMLSLSHDGVSRRCPPTATAHPLLSVPVLMSTAKDGSSVYKALPLPEASAGFHCSIWLMLVGWSPCTVWGAGA